MAALRIKPLGSEAALYARRCMQIRRIYLPRTSVNKGKEKGRGCSKLRPPNG